MRIGIFGGSFNPIHTGHVNVARIAIQERGLDKVLVIPAKCSPFKTDEPAPLPDALRRVLVTQACAPYPQLIPDFRELDRGGISYTIDTVREITAEYPGAELFLITGEDAAAGFDGWREAETLRNCVTLITFPRTHESSTEVRARLARQEPLADLVPQAVADFLEARAVVFDYGGVLAYAPGETWPLYEKAATYGISREVLRAAFTSYRHLWDGGFISGRVFYRRIAAAAGVSLPDATLDELLDADSSGWTKMCPHSLELMRALHTLKRKVGILTNMSEEFYRDYFCHCAGDYAAEADALVVSGQHRLYKPGRPIYDLMAKKLDLAPRDLLFLDDTNKNVLAARSYGWRAQRYVCAERRN